MSSRAVYFATCAKGLEPILHEELSALRMGKIERQVGGVRFEGTRADAWRANLWLRTANRVLLRLSSFDAREERALYEGVGAIDWSQWIAPEASLIVDARVQESSLTHSRFAEQRVKDAIVDQVRERSGARPSVDREEPDLRVHLHLWRDRAVLSIDTSGPALYLRGWRVHQGRAPLAETLAAGMVLASGWDHRAPLLDPFAGSGTILVEAALLASARAPGLFRKSFAFERLPDHDAAAFASLREETAKRAQVPRKLRLLGRDREQARIDEAVENAAAAGVGDLLELERGDALDLAPRAGWNAWIVSNPPYGERVGDDRELGALYPRFVTLLRERCQGYRYAILSGNPLLSRALAPLSPRRIPLKNGALECELLHGIV
jgi:23S rRNA G2445 N2-methylase RlmL